MRASISRGFAHHIGRFVKLLRALPDITVLHFELAELQFGSSTAYTYASCGLSAYQLKKKTCSFNFLP